MPVLSISSPAHRRAPAILITVLAAWLGGAATGFAQQPAPAADGALVKAPPLLQNRAEIAREAASAFPAGLPNTLRSGTVMANVRVLPDGRVDSMVVMWSTHPAFAGPAKALAAHMRFAPGKGADGSLVTAWARVPLFFERDSGPANGERRLAADAPNATGGGAAPAAGETGAPPDEGTYTLTAIEVQPRLRNGGEIERMIAGAYPQVLRDSGVVGHVTVRFRIEENGTVTPESVAVQHATHPGFAGPAMDAVRKMLFSPARIGRLPVKVWVTIPITFSLVDDSPSQAPRSADAPRAPRP